MAADWKEPIISYEAQEAYTDNDPVSDVRESQGKTDFKEKDDDLAKQKNDFNESDDGLAKEKNDFNESDVAMVSGIKDYRDNWIPGEDVDFKDAEAVDGLITKVAENHRISENANTAADKAVEPHRIAAESFERDSAVEPEMAGTR